MHIKTRFLIILIAFALGCALGACRGTTDANGKWETISGSPDKSQRSRKKSAEINQGGYLANLPTGFQRPEDDFRKKIVREYGAVYVAKGGAVLPSKVGFADDREASDFQSEVSGSRETLDGTSVELQKSAMDALLEARREAAANKLSISPRGQDSSRRSYGGTVELWASRVNPGLSHWVGKGRLSADEANRIRGLPMAEQIPEILRLEDSGLYFSKDLSKSIMYSVAPPGTSQHLLMLAFDVAEYENRKVRGILAKYGWFQTVISDLPHFTYLGVSEAELTSLGLKSVSRDGRTFWIPDIR